jgi:cytochrome c-type biogenesis protein CcmF
MAGFVGAKRPSQAWRESARNGLWVVTALVTVAAVILLYLLLSGDFQVRYVWQYTSTHMPAVYRVSAFWAGEAGSLLLWLWFLTVLSLLLLRSDGDRGGLSAFLPVPMAITQAFFALVMLTTGNPFDMLATRPAEGLGMLPLLENPGMVVHPPVLFMGYAGYTVPFAFAFAALLSGDLNSKWVKAMRRWSMFAWLFLSLGILIGAWWSYVELGWGGYWAWDPVENASLIPWLIGTALLHSTIMEERRGMQKVWNLALSTLAFVLCLFATLVTRGGIIVSELHGFASSIQPIAYYLMAFIAMALTTSLALIYRRRNQLTSKRALERLLSREGSFLLVELLLCGAALIVLLGTLYPTLSRGILGIMVGLNASFYDRAVGPVLGAIVALMGICPVIGWQRLGSQSLRNLNFPSLAGLVLTGAVLVLGVREPFPLLSTAVSSFVFFSIVAQAARDLAAGRRSTGESLARAGIHLLSRGRRRYGAYLVHLAIVLMAVGITGSSAYKTEELVALRPGEAALTRGYEIRYEDYTIETVNANPVTRQSRVRYAALLDIERGSSNTARLVAEKNYHWALEAPWVTEVAIHSSLREDLYVVLANLEQDGLAGFELVINPLVSWIWIGGGVLLIGTLMAAWPDRRDLAEEVQSA